MAVSNAAVQALFLESIGALNMIIADPDASDDEVAEAKTASKLLARKFVGQALANVAERTEKFQEFIAEMEKVIKAIGSRRGLLGLKSLKAIVEKATGLLGGG